MPFASIYFQRGLRSAQPAATAVNAGTLYKVTDEGVTERSNGTIWEDYSDAGSPTTNASLLSSGTLPDGRFPATLPAASGVNLTALNASNIGSGTVPTARLGSGAANGSSFLRGDQTWAAAGGSAGQRTIGIVIDGAGSVITTGVKGFVSVPFSGTITKARVLSADPAATSGSIVVDVWKDTYANYPPADADSITASAPPTISAATKSEDSTLTGWTTSVTAGDVFGFNVDSVTSLTRVVVELTVQE